MSKFKVGDEVIKVRGKWENADIQIGDEGIIDSDWRGIGYYILITKGRHEGNKCCSEACNFELKSIYNSPLYKALL